MGYQNNNRPLPTDWQGALLDDAICDLSDLKEDIKNSNADNKLQLIEDINFIIETLKQHINHINSIK